MIAALLILLLAPQAKAYDDNGIYSEQTCVVQFWADKTVVAGWTPTITPTYTPMPVPVLEATPYVIFSVGNSHVSAGNCADGNEYDGFRPALLAARNARGKGSRWQGSLLKTYPTPLVQNSLTDSVGGTDANSAYVHIRDNVIPNIGTPSANHRLLIMSVANDAKVSATEAYVKSVVYASVTIYTNADPSAKVWLTNDMPIVGYDSTSETAGVLDAYNQLVSDGKAANVIFVDSNSCVNYPADYCGGGDPGHITITSYRKLGGCLDSLIQAAGD